MGKIKIRILKEKYYSIGKNVYCELFTQPFIDNVSMAFTEPIHFLGEANYKAEDTFDFKKGKAIAKAKAERASYKCWKKFIQQRMKAAERTLASSLLFIYNAKYIINHNTEYIKKLTQ